MMEDSEGWPWHHHCPAAMLCSGLQKPLKKQQKNVPAFKELIVQPGRPDTTEFSSKLDGHGASE